MNETVALKGRCLCGAIEILADAATRNITACHCKMCRRWTGGPLIIVDCGSSVRIENQVGVSYHQTSEWGERGFCAQCGSGLFYHYFEGNQYYVPAGLFELEDFKLNKEICIDEKPAYYAFLNETETITEKEFCKLKYGVDKIETVSGYNA